jgi:RNA polymerase primary sigma factor
MLGKKKKARYTEDNLLAYFNQIKNKPLLSAEEEWGLSKKILKGSEEAKSRLIESNLRLVVKIARGFISKDVQFLDLVQEGNIGLMKAAEKFDYRKSVRFSTYAAWWIKQAIVRSLSNKKRAIRLPHRKEEAIKRIQRAYMSLAQKYSRSPSVAEVAKELGLQEGEVLELLHASTSIVSLEAETNNDAGTLMDMCEDNSFNPDRALEEKSMQEDTLRFLEHLMEREKEILKYRFSFYGNHKYTLKTIGERMGISPETVRQIEKRAIRKLKEHAYEVQDYVYH